MFGPRPINEGPKVTLDQQAFRALASEVRVEILKKLDEKRRLTVTHLSKEMGLSKPTLLEHLGKLTDATLVKRVDEGRKWIYYELTDRGRKVLHPERVTIVVALTLSLLLMASGFYILTLPSGYVSAPAGTDTPLEAQPPSFDPLIGTVLLFLGTVAAVAAVLLGWRGRVVRRRFFQTLV